MQEAALPSKFSEDISASCARRRLLHLHRRGPALSRCRGRRGGRDHRPRSRGSGPRDGGASGAPRLRSFLAVRIHGDRGTRAPPSRARSESFAPRPRLSHFRWFGSHRNRDQAGRQYFLERGDTKRFRVVSRKQSYHGSTLGALSVSGNVRRREPFAPLLSEWGHIPPCYCYRCPMGLQYPACNVDCADELERLLRREGPGIVAAFHLRAGERRDARRIRSARRLSPAHRGNLPEPRHPADRR